MIFLENDAMNQHKQITKECLCFQDQYARRGIYEEHSINFQTFFRMGTFIG